MRFTAPSRQNSRTRHVGEGERCGADHHVADRHRPRSPVTLNFIKITQSI